MDTWEILKNISIISASWAVFYGVDAWRREFIGKRRMELAEEVLALFYEVRDAISDIRSPFGFDGEGSTRKANPKETPEETQILNNAYVVFERYQKHQELFNRLHSIRYRVMAQLGKESAAPFDELWKIRGEILSAAQNLARYWVHQNRIPINSSRSDEYAKLILRGESIFWDQGDNDLINPRLDKMVSSIELTCRAIIESKGTLFSVLNIPLGKRSKPGKK